MEKVEELPKAVEYIQLTQEIVMQDASGRFTTLCEGACGLILNEEGIPTLWDINEAQKASLLEKLRCAGRSARVLALVAGYPIILSEHQFVRKKSIGNPRIPWEIII
ncbi:MAG: hypothetical protein LLG04_01315 [Parachlamydia sp.]|nr:hypothetical protein [Parachlamydia sp.]